MKRLSFPQSLAKTPSRQESNTGKKILFAIVSLMTRAITTGLLLAGAVLAQFRSGVSMVEADAQVVNRTRTIDGLDDLPLARSPWTWAARGG